MCCPPPYMPPCWGALRDSFSICKSNHWICPKGDPDTGSSSGRNLPKYVTVLAVPKVSSRPRRSRPHVTSLASCCLACHPYRHTRPHTDPQDPLTLHRAWPPAFGLPELSLTSTCRPLPGMQGVKTPFVCPLCGPTSVCIV